MTGLFWALDLEVAAEEEVAEAAVEVAMTAEAAVEAAVAVEEEVAAAHKARRSPTHVA